MKALVAKFSLGKEVWDRFKSRLLSRPSESHALSLELTEIPEFSIIGSQWVKIRTIMSGISGMDESLFIHNDLSPYAAFLSFPFIPGHENLGLVIQTGRDVDGIEEGERVILDPVLSCRPRGVNPPCPSCARGEPSACRNFDKGLLGPGILIGACRDTGGGWSDGFIAHRSQVRVLPQDMESDHAILVPEFTRAVRAVLQHPPSPGDSVIVVGARPLGCLTAMALRLVHPNVNVLMVEEYPLPTDLQAKFSDHHVTLSLGIDLAYEEVAQFVKGAVRYPEVGRLTMEGGADLVYETTGTGENIEHALRFTGEGRKLVLLDMNRPMGFDFSPLWLKNIRMFGTLFSGRDSYKQGVLETFDIALGLASMESVSFRELITHKFRLEDYHSAFQTLKDRSSNGAMKVIFQHVM
jgi:threonine dehydrogenase-like Zn-dependent dehydrogenase